MSAAANSALHLKPTQLATAEAVVKAIAATARIVASLRRPGSRVRPSAKPAAAPAIAAAAPRVGVRELAVSNSRPGTTRGRDADRAESRKRLTERLSSAST